MVCDAVVEVSWVPFHCYIKHTLACPLFNIESKKLGAPERVVARCTYTVDVARAKSCLTVIHLGFCRHPAMSLSSTSTIKSQLITTLGPSKSTTYFALLNAYISAKISRIEFDEAARQTLDTSHLLQLHNSLVVSLFDFSAHHVRQKEKIKAISPAVEEEAGKPVVLKKRRRALPYQGDASDADDEDDGLLRTKRLKRWVVSLGKRERDRIKALLRAPPNKSRPEAEINRERSVLSIPERGMPAGARMPVVLSSVSRHPMHIQHIMDRITLTSAQHNLMPPRRDVAMLLKEAVEAKLKEIIERAIELQLTKTTTEGTRTLNAQAFSNLFALSPSVLPNNSASALALITGGGATGVDDALDSMDREVSDPRWQLFALLAERSTVKDALKSAMR